MNPSNNCITIFSCGAGTCDDGDEVDLGMGNVDAAGNFFVVVAPPLVTGQRVFARDTCNGLDGAPVTVLFTSQIPDLSATGAALLVLLLAGLLVVRTRIGTARQIG